jgi:Domain of Unknown Function (DUF748)
MVSKEAKRRILWLVGVLGLIVLGTTFIASHYINPIIRLRVERGMNRNLQGYQTSLKSVHLSLLDGTLFLYGLDVIQEAHPQPPVIKIPTLRVHIQWSELFWGRVVAECLISQPTARIDLPQLRTEASRKTPLKQEGWQQALQSIYPFKFNKFQIQDGDITYIDADSSRPIRLEHLELSADNIRNIHVPENRYPSSIHVETAMFGTGRATIDGHANFLAEPIPGILARYRMEHVPLAPLDSAIERVNLKVKNGLLWSSGIVEYAPNIKRAEVELLRLYGVQIYYFHTPDTAQAEAARIHIVKLKAETVTNKPEVVLKLHLLKLLNSTITYTNEDSDHHYQLYLSHLNGTVINLSSHSSDGNSTIALDGQFMGNGTTNLTGSFRPEKHGSDFDLNLMMQRASLPSLNDLLRAYGKFDVQSGNLSVYSQATVRRGQTSGYVKTLFSNVVVYNHDKDKNKPILHQVYEMVIGGAAKLLKNSSTHDVATQVSLSGKLSNPNANTWEALRQLFYNAFVSAIRPGFDREVPRRTEQHGELGSTH